MKKKIVWLCSVLLFASLASAETKAPVKGKEAKKDAKDESILPAPARAEGEGPFKRLILRGVPLIDGTGAPAIGPVDIVIEKNRIVDVASVGSPGVTPDPEKR